MANYEDKITYEEAEDDYVNDPDYVPSSESSESEEEENNVPEETVDEPLFREDEYEDEYEEADNKIKDPDYVPEEKDSEDSESDVASIISEDEKHFGCDGCDYEWKDGWKTGWKDAMKYMRNQLNIEVPLPPKCDNCGMSRKTQKCGGKCKGAVRYCSVKCQTVHWRSHHKYECS